MENSEYTKVKPYSSGVYWCGILWLILLALVIPLVLLFIKDPIVSLSVLLAEIVGVSIFLSIKYGAGLKKRNKVTARQLLLTAVVVGSMLSSCFIILDVIFKYLLRQ